MCPKGGNHDLIGMSPSLNQGGQGIYVLRVDGTQGLGQCFLRGYVPLLACKEPECLLRPRLEPSSNEVRSNFLDDSDGSNEPPLFFRSPPQIIRKPESRSDAPLGSWNEFRLFPHRLTPIRDCFSVVSATFDYKGFLTHSS